MNINHHRQLFLTSTLGRRQFRECLTSFSIGFILKPCRLWLVSPWVSDFEVIDNQALEWSTVCPWWEARQIKFSEVLVAAIQQGCTLNIVTNNAEMNPVFIRSIRDKLGEDARMRFHDIVSEKLHTKGFLGDDFFIKGSMNFTYSGSNINEEHVTITLSEEEIKEAHINFKKDYQPGDSG